MSDAKVTREHRLAFHTLLFGERVPTDLWSAWVETGEIAKGTTFGALEDAERIAQAIANAEQRGRDAERSAVCAMWNTKPQYHSEFGYRVKRGEHVKGEG